jgi:predicted XRE-type DNA-binding protein
VQTLQELGRAVALHRHALQLKQGYVACQAGISQECLSRFERGRAQELGSRKLLAILNVLGMELSLQFKEYGDQAHFDTAENLKDAK